LDVSVTVKTVTVVCACGVVRASVAVTIDAVDNPGLVTRKPEGTDNAILDVLSFTGVDVIESVAVGVVGVAGVIRCVETVVALCVTV
jgi:hypothetical protein